MLKLSRLPGLAALALLCATPAAAEFDNDFASGVLSAGRNQTLVCSGVNGGFLADVKVSLKSPVTGELIHPDATNTCATNGGGGICSVSHKHNSALPLLAYCHVEADNAETVGNLQLNIPTGVSDASTDLQPVLPSEAGCDDSFEVPEEDLLTGALTVGRNDTAVCTGVNKGTENAVMRIQLFSPTVTIPFKDCSSVEPGEGCEFSYKHTSPVPAEFRCLITATNGIAVGNLRRDTPVNTSEASTDLAVTSSFCTPIIPDDL